MKNEDALHKINFETLDTETVRILCAFAVNHMDAKDISHPVFRSVADIDPLVAVAVRLNNQYEGCAMWKQLNKHKSKESVMTLLECATERIKCNPTNYFTLDSSDIDLSLILDADVVRFIIANREVVGNKGRIHTSSGVFSSVCSSMLVEAYAKDPILISTLIALFPVLMRHLEVSHEWNPKTAESVEIIKTAMGFMHKFDNDTPAILYFIAPSSNSNLSPSPVFDQLLMYLCNTCRNDEAAIKRYRSDLSNDLHGGKASRNKKAGWLTRYMNRKWENGDQATVLSLIKLIPPLLSLVHSKAKNSKELRTYNRLYQLSGDS